MHELVNIVLDGSLSQDNRHVVFCWDNFLSSHIYHVTESIKA